MPMRKPAVNLPEPLPTFAVPERPPSSERNRVAIRIDGITYLMDAKQNGIVTPLSEPYEQEILRRTEADNLADALHTIRHNSTSE